jgi:hypothetical protein
VRPLKNQVEQAVGALRFARERGWYLRFHVNCARVECRGEPVVKALRDMFASQPDAALVEHGWLERDTFLRLCAEMDVGSQVSYSETFCIVAADLTSAGVPTLGSAEIPWLPPEYQADPNSAEDIKRGLGRVLKLGPLPAARALASYSTASRAIWLKWLG